MLPRKAGGERGEENDWETARGGKRKKRKRLVDSYRGVFERTSDSIRRWFCVVCVCCIAVIFFFVWFSSGRRLLDRCSAIRRRREGECGGKVETGRGKPHSGELLFVLHWLNNVRSFGAIALSFAGGQKRPKKQIARGSQGAAR